MIPYIPVHVMDKIVFMASSDTERKYYNNKLVCKGINAIPYQSEWCGYRCLTTQETMDSDIAKIKAELVYTPPDMYNASVGEPGGTRRRYQFSCWMWHFLVEVPYVDEEDEE